MQPQDETKPTEQNSTTHAAPARVPVTVKGQRYAAPVGRHSQQTHRRAEQRVAAQGHTSEKEQQVADRAAIIDGIAETAAEKTRHQERSKPR